MKKVYFFSGSGNSLAVAGYIADKMGIQKVEITPYIKNPTAETAFVVFPVYCQNIPVFIKKFLSSVNAEKVVIIATYGGISYGNVLYEASEIIKCKTIAATALSMKHSLLVRNEKCDFHSLDNLIEGIPNPSEILLQKHEKNIFADFFPSLRSRIEIKITRNDNCSGCNLCGKICPVNGISKGKCNSNCIRCLKCVRKCPNHALSFKLGPFLKIYLRSELSS